MSGSTVRGKVDPDAELVQRVGRGDSKACASLVDRHLARVTAIAYRMLGNSADADDVAQDTFLRVWQHAGTWRSGQALFSTWLYTVTVNLCRDRLRRRRETGLDVVADVADERFNAEAELQHDRVSQIVDVALAELPERQRTALTLCHYQGLSNIDSAVIMGVSVEAIESLLARARRNLRKKLHNQIADLRGDP